MEGRFTHMQCISRVVNFSHTWSDAAQHGAVITTNLHQVDNILMIFKIQACQIQQLGVCSVSIERECCSYWGKEFHSYAAASSKRMPVTFQTLINLLNIFLNVWSFNKMCKSGVR